MWKDKLKKQWDENPLAVMSIGALVATAAAKVVDTMTSVQSRRAYQSRSTTGLLIRSNSKKESQKWLSFFFS